MAPKGFQTKYASGEVYEKDQNVMFLLFEKFKKHPEKREKLQYMLVENIDELTRKWFPSKDEEDEFWSETAKKFHPIIRYIMICFEDLVGDAFFISTEVWIGRGEDYCKGSEFVLVFDSSPLYRVLNLPSRGDVTLDSALKNFPVFHELGEAWYCGFYEW
jgi:hypothetical protein